MEHNSHSFRKSNEQQHDSSSQQNGKKQFSTAEEAIRADAAEVELPPQIEARLKQTLSTMTGTDKKGWWRKWF
ncbi:MAG: hypothetical protein JWM04_280 [Verrucomicrobiales bacterium]|nr:hypothetical protein [Verrucomicrobiales bacterium]